MLTEQTVKLKPENDETWDAWVVPPVPIFFNYYFFHVTNAADFEAGRAQKPSVVEVGPYAWEETREKVHINEIDVDLIQYGQFYEFYWSQRETDRWQLFPCLLRSCNNIYTVTAAVAAVEVAAALLVLLAWLQRCWYCWQKLLLLNLLLLLSKLLLLLLLQWLQRCWYCWTGCCCCC